MSELAPGVAGADRSTRFVDHVIHRCMQDKGLAARLRRADNPATEYQCWELLLAFGIDLESEGQRLPYQTVAACIARAGVEHNGSQSLGGALAACYGANSAPARARLHRLLACDSVGELCRIVRAQVDLVACKGGAPLDYRRLLRQLIRFGRDARRIKARWAREFYGHVAEEEAQ
jgi:CRISPR system Cascade subunit CasB